MRWSACLLYALFWVHESWGRVRVVIDDDGSTPVLRRTSTLEMTVRVEAQDVAYSATPMELCVFHSCGSEAVDACTDLFVTPVHAVRFGLFFEECLPGQHMITAYAAEVSLRGDCIEAYREGCSLDVDQLLGTAGDGAYDQRLFTVEPEDGGAWIDPLLAPLGETQSVSQYEYATIYTSGGSGDRFRWWRQARLLSRLLELRGADVLEFGCGILGVAASAHGVPRVRESMPLLTETSSIRATP